MKIKLAVSTPLSQDALKAVARAKNYHGPQPRTEEVFNHIIRYRDDVATVIPVPTWREEGGESPRAHQCRTYLAVHRTSYNGVAGHYVTVYESASQQTVLNLREITPSSTAGLLAELTASVMCIEIQDDGKLYVTVNNGAHTGYVAAGYGYGFKRVEQFAYKLDADALKEQPPRNVWKFVSSRSFDGGYPPATFEHSTDGYAGNINVFMNGATYVVLGDYQEATNSFGTSVYARDHNGSWTQLVDVEQISVVDTVVALPSNYYLDPRGDGATFPQAVAFSLMLNTYTSARWITFARDSTGTRVLMDYQWYTLDVEGRRAYDGVYQSANGTTLMIVSRDATVAPATPSKEYAEVFTLEGGVWTSRMQMDVTGASMNVYSFRSYYRVSDTTARLPRFGPVSDGYRPLLGEDMYDLTYYPPRVLNTFTWFLSAHNYGYYYIVAGYDDPSSVLAGLSNINETSKTYDLVVDGKGADGSWRRLLLIEKLANLVGTYTVAFQFQFQNVAVVEGPGVVLVHTFNFYTATYSTTLRVYSREANSLELITEVQSGQAPNPGDGVFSTAPVKTYARACLTHVTVGYVNDSGSQQQLWEKVDGRWQMTKTEAVDPPQPYSLLYSQSVTNDVAASNVVTAVSGGITKVYSNLIANKDGKRPWRLVGTATGMVSASSDAVDRVFVTVQTALSPSDPLYAPQWATRHDTTTYTVVDGAWVADASVDRRYGVQQSGRIAGIFTEDGSRLSAIFPGYFGFDPRINNYPIFYQFYRERTTVSADGTKRVEIDPSLKHSVVLNGVPSTRCEQLPTSKFYAFSDHGKFGLHSAWGRIYKG